MSRANRTLPCFTAYLFFTLAQLSLPFIFDMRSEEYRTSFFATMCFVVAMRFMVVVELAQKVLRSYKGIEVISGKLLWFMTFASVLLSATGALDSLHIWGAPWREAAYYSLSVLIRWSGWALCIACGLIGFFSVYFGDGLPRNIKRHSWILSGYFASIGIGFLVVNRTTGYVDLVSEWLLLAATGCYGSWGMLLSSDGEAVPAMKRFSEAEISAIDAVRDTALHTMRRVQFQPITRLFQLLRRGIDPIPQKSEEKSRSAGA